MSRLNPCANSMTGPEAGPEARTSSSVPSNERTGPRSSGGSAESRSRASGSSARRRAFSTARPITPPATAPAATLAVTIAVRRPVTRATSRPSSPDVLPRDALADRGHDLVPDRPEVRSELLGGDALTPLRPDQDDLVAHQDLVVAAVHEDLVHGHRPRDAVASPTDQHLGPVPERTLVAVLVADRDRRDGRLALERVAPAVREPLARGQALHHGHGRAPRERRAQPEPWADPAARIDAVDRGPRADHVEMALRVQDRRRAVRRVDAGGLDTAPADRVPGAEEPAELIPRAPLVLLGRGEMGPQSLEHQTGVHDSPGERGRRLRRPQAHSVHPRVDLEVDADRPSHRSRGLRDAAQAVLGVDGRREPRGKRLLLGAGRELREHEDRSLDAPFAQAEALLDERHADPARARLQGRPGHCRVPVSVAVRLHHGEQLGGRRLDQPDVVADRLEVHLDDRGPVPGHAPANSRSASATRSSTSPAVAPSPCSAAASAPAAPCTYAAADAASAGANPRARNPAIMPVSTSPVPPLARNGPPVGLIRTCPSGVPTSVRVPFSSTTARVWAASLRTWPIRSASTSRAETPARRANSPACGVRTRSARRSAISSALPPNAFSPSASRTTGISLERTISRIQAAVSSSVVIPGPIATASASPSTCASRSDPPAAVPRSVSGRGANTASRTAP